jgi:4'-phosphopantetheinyl transferase EntD
MIRTNPARLSTAFASLFPSRVVACELREPADAALLLPAEAACVSRSAPKRIQEFTGGRLCARRALAEFGIASEGLGVGVDRQVDWPASMVGTITHTAGLCAAAVAERRHFAALGLDSEVIGDVKQGIWPKIATLPEILWLESLAPDMAAAGATLLFAAKEAFYKCQYPLAAERLGFHDIEVSVAPPEWQAGRGEFLVQPLRAIAYQAHADLPFRGRFLLHDEFASAGVATCRERDMAVQGPRQTSAT